MVRARERVAEERARLRERATGAPSRGRAPTKAPAKAPAKAKGRPRAAAGSAVDLRAATELRDGGAKALDVAQAILEACGFCDIEAGVALRNLGLSVDFRARDADGAFWLFEIVRRLLGDTAGATAPRRGVAGAGQSRRPARGAAARRAKRPRSARPPHDRCTAARVTDASCARHRRGPRRRRAHPGRGRDVRPDGQRATGRPCRRCRRPVGARAAHGWTGLS